MESSKKILKRKLKASTIIALIVVSSLFAYIEMEIINQAQNTAKGLEASTEQSLQPANNTETAIPHSLNGTESSNSTKKVVPTDNSSLVTNQPKQVSSNSVIRPNYTPQSTGFNFPIGNPNTNQTSETADSTVNNDSLPSEISNQSELTPIQSASSTNYLAFNVLIDLNGAGIARFLRESIMHNVSNEGAIVMQIFNLTSRTWTSKTTVFNSLVDDRNFGVGKIDSNIYLFFTKIEAISHKSEFGYIKSTDLTCKSWSAFNVLSAENNLSAYGKMVQVNTSTFLMPVYSFDGTTNYTLQIWRSTNSGDNWSWYSNIYSGPSPYTEFDLTSIGNNNMIATIRSNIDCHLYQAVSSNAGFSWSDITLTNLGFGGPTPYVNAALYDNATRNFVLVGWNSAVGNLEISITPALKVLNNSSSYIIPKILDSTGLTEATYPNIVKLANGAYLIGYSKVVQSATVIEPWQIIYAPASVKP